MRKLIFILIILSLSFYGKGQGRTGFINNPETGSNSTLTGFEGGLVGDSALLISKVIYADTTAANWCAVSFYSNAVIITGTTGNYKLWFRTLNPPVWTQLANNGSVPSTFNPIAGWGILLSGTYPNITFKVDSLSVASFGRLYKATDSLANLVLHIADTTAMLAPYLRKSDTSTMLIPYLRKSDTASMLSPYLRSLNLRGTPNQVIVTPSGSNTILSTPQNIDTLAVPQFSSQLIKAAAGFFNTATTTYYRTEYEDLTGLFLRSVTNTNPWFVGLYSNTGNLVFYNNLHTALSADSATGNISLSSLVGTGTRMVTASSTGLLSTQAITTGTVTSVTGNAPLSFANSTTTPLGSIDTGRAAAEVATGGSLDKVRDSLQANINLKLNISDTAAMLSHETLDRVLANGNSSGRDIHVSGIFGNVFGDLNDGSPLVLWGGSGTTNTQLVKSASTLTFDYSATRLNTPVLKVGAPFATPSDDILVVQDKQATLSNSNAIIQLVGTSSSTGAIGTGTRIEFGHRFGQVGNFYQQLGDTTLQWIGIKDSTAALNSYVDFQINKAGGIVMPRLGAGTSTDSVMTIDASGNVHYRNVSSVGTGTVTSVATNNGTGISGGTITSSGTLLIDTLNLSTRLWRQKGIDSLNGLIALRVKYTDTASMLSPYLRKTDTSTMLSPYARTSNIPALGTAPANTVFGNNTGSGAAGSFQTSVNVSGSVTGGAANFTTVTASGQILSTMGNNTNVFRSASATTGYQYALITNTAATGVFGIEGSTPGTIQTGTLAYAAIFGNAANVATQFTTNSVVRCTIDISGNVGIGTTSPQTKEVVSNGGANGYEVNPANGTGTKVSSYNRTFSVYTPLTLDNDSLLINQNGIAIGTGGLYVNNGLVQVTPPANFGSLTTLATHTIFTPTTGSTINLTNNAIDIVNPAGALLALTINLPSSPNNNDVVIIKFTKAITTVTYTGGTISDSLLSPAAGGMSLLTYDLSSNTWY